MILVDTSVWVSYLRAGNSNLERLLNDGEVACHPFIIGELACGNIKNRTEILSLLSLPRASGGVSSVKVLSVSKKGSSPREWGVSFHSIKTIFTLAICITIW